MPFLGILTAIGLVLLAYALYALPSGSDAIVGALALLIVLLAGSELLSQSQLLGLMVGLIYRALQRRRSAPFQAAISLAAPVLRWRRYR
jgi:hypothetical protein